MTPKLKRYSKLILRTDDLTWSKVQVFKLENNIPSNNDAVNLLLELGLEQKTIAHELIVKYSRPKER